MKFLSGIKNASSKKESILNGVLLVFAFFLVCPFFLLTYFNNPSFDDYSLVYNTTTLGFWGAQVAAYLKWTGRNFSLFILSAHPLVIGSFTIYKLISAILLLLTIHSLYRFISIISPFSGKANNFLLSIVFAFCFLNGMPTLSEGIYWMPGSITYHFANILTLYLAINILNITSSNFPASSTFKKFVNYLLIFAICGLSETSMVVVDVLLTIFLLYDILSKKRIKTELLIYVLFAILCSLIVVLAPGNNVRESDFIDPNKHQFIFTIISSFKTAGRYISEWIFSLPLLISSAIIFVYYLVIPEKKIAGKRLIFLFLIVLGGFLLIACSFLPAFWSMASVPPNRTMNVAYWVFICVCLTSIIILLNLVTLYLKPIQNSNFKFVILLPLSALFFISNSPGNYSIAIKDILSGKAFLFDKECRERDTFLKESKDSICNVPVYSVFPRSIYNGSLETDEVIWWNYLSAQYYKKSEVRLFFKDPFYSDKYFINFENSENKRLLNQAALSDEVFFSTPNSSVLAGADSYSATFIREVGTLKVENISDITSSHVTVLLYSIDSVVNARIVLCIKDPEGKENIFWAGKEIISTTYVKNKWIKEEGSFSIPSQFLEPKNLISVFIWNKGQSKIFIDNLQICIY
ncbi:MAG: hypothetical protein H0W84_01735 [Bacteroidetes bacterium]|nr:hypothetical protein [Bacteroidota bacterium]